MSRASGLTSMIERNSPSTARMRSRYASASERAVWRPICIDACNSFTDASSNSHMCAAFAGDESACA